MVEEFGKATFGGGCFWCTETVYQRVNGVKSVIPGYAGGNTPNPTYREVCTGKTGHAEVVQITFNPREVSYEQLLEVFWLSHDPTTLNRQGPDTGTQYRSIILYHDKIQEKTAKKSKSRFSRQLHLQRARRLSLVAALWGHAVTQIKPLADFFPAEEEHRDFYNKYSGRPNLQGGVYCENIIDPKLRKLGLKE